MPELAEVEWFRKQWNPGRGHDIVDLSLHRRNRVFRGANTRELPRRLVGEKFLTSQARGKRMLFEFTDNNWLGIHLGMTGKIRIEPKNFRPSKHDHLVLYQRERAALFDVAKFVVREWLETLGEDFSDPPRSWLIHQKWKVDGICPRHRTSLRHATIGGRTTVWCPRCQR